MVLAVFWTSRRGYTVSGGFWDVYDFMTLTAILGCALVQKRARLQAVGHLEPGIYLATTYSHKTYRLTTIGAAAFHFRVRNGTGWFHRALVTRGQHRLTVLGLWGSELCVLTDKRASWPPFGCPLPGIHTETFQFQDLTTHNPFTVTCFH